MTNLELIKFLEAKLASSENNPVVAKWIFCFVNNISEVDLIQHYANQATKKNKCIKYTNQYINGKPLARILKKSSFYGYEFIVNNNVFIPRLETELLVDKLNEITTSNLVKLNILDMCCGCGAIGIAIQLCCHNQHNLTLIDISKKAIKNTSINLQKLGCSGVVYQSDLFCNYKSTKPFDVIIFNPPYIAKSESINKTIKKYDPTQALFANDNGLAVYKKFFATVKPFLNPSNYILGIEIGSQQGKAVSEIVKKLDVGIEIEIIKDYNKLDRFIIARKTNV